MNLSAKENFYILTKLSPAQVQVKLDQMMDLSNYQFTSYAAGSVFKLQPISDFKKSFGLEVQGLVEPLENGSRIDILIQLPKNTSVYLTMLAAILLIAGIMALINMAISKGGKYNIFPWFSFYLIYFPWLSSFKTQSKKTKAMLIDIFESQ